MFVVMAAETVGGGGDVQGVASEEGNKGLGDCGTIILISCAERLHAMLIASRGIFNKYFIQCSIITA